MNSSRRDFLKHVGTGAICASLGTTLTGTLGLSRAFALQDEPRLTFGAMEPLVSLLQETPIAKLQPMLVNKVKEGQVTPRDLIGAAALANARTFGGEDYIGFHTMFSLVPTYLLSKELPQERQLLPILKMLYRNTNRIHEFGGRAKEVLRPVAPAELPEGKSGGDAIREAVRGGDVKTAEARLATACKSSPAEAFNQVQEALHDGTEVHRVNMVYRAWGLLEIVGLDHAHTLLRESLHYFVAAEKNKNNSFASSASCSRSWSTITTSSTRGRAPGSPTPRGWRPRARSSSRRRRSAPRKSRPRRSRKAGVPKACTRRSRSGPTSSCCATRPSRPMAQRSASTPATP